MKKITVVREEMEKTLGTFPNGETKFDAITISSILEIFKTKTRQAEKITKKYLPGQEVLTIDYKQYDSIEEYYLYLLNNKCSIHQGLEEILHKVRTLEK